jgi:ATP synthase protein I
MGYMDEYAKYSGLVFQMSAIVVIGIFGGIKLDKVLNLNHPVFTIVLTIVSTTIAIYHLFRTILKK